MITTLIKEFMMSDEKDHLMIRFGKAFEASASGRLSVVLLVGFGCLLLLGRARAWW